MEISQSSYHDKKQETEGSGAFYLDQMSYCWARWNTAWRWTCEENLLLNCHSPVSWAVPNSRGRILAIYAQEGCRQSPVTALAQQEEELLFLLASQGWGSETSPAPLQAGQQLPLGCAGGCEIPAGTGEPFGVKLCLRWNSIGISFLLFISLPHFLLLFPLSAFTAFPSVFFLVGLLIFT